MTSYIMQTLSRIWTFNSIVHQKYLIEAFTVSFDVLIIFFNFTTHSSTNSKSYYVIKKSALNASFKDFWFTKINKLICIKGKTFTTQIFTFNKY